MKTQTVTYQIWFHSPNGWYCPDGVWKNPDVSLVIEWKNHIRISRRKDVQVRAFLDDKYCPALSIK